MHHSNVFSVFKQLKASVLRCQVQVSTGKEAKSDLKVREHQCHMGLQMSSFQGSDPFFSQSALLFYVGTLVRLSVQLRCI